MVTSAIPDGFEYADEEFRIPRSVVKFTSVLFAGVLLFVTITLIVTGLPASLWISVDTKLTFNAKADTGNRKKIIEMYDNFFKYPMNIPLNHPLLLT
ncbi:MAG: hypothetical protein SCH66_01690 [Methanolobus sp.]|nr:hypothetical protein [Methanolobus sp.]